MDRYANEEIPTSVPVKLPHPSYAVIARLVLLDGAQEWRPARAVRWNETHVMVKLQEKEGAEPEYVWLRSADVRRVFRRPPPSSHPR